MPAPTTFADLSTTAASNFPSGSDNVFPSLDDTLRVHAACLASIMANSGNGWTSPYARTASPTFTGTVGIGRTAATTVDIQSAAQTILRLRAGTGASEGSAVYGTAGSDTTSWAIGQYGAIYGGTVDGTTAIYSAGALSLGDSGAERVRITGGNLKITGGNLEIQNAVGAPGVPTGGGYLYVEAGALKFRGSSGTITTVAPA